MGAAVWDGMLQSEDRRFHLAMTNLSHILGLPIQPPLSTGSGQSFPTTDAAADHKEALSLFCPWFILRHSCNALPALCFFRHKISNDFSPSPLTLLSLRPKIHCSPRGNRTNSPKHPKTVVHELFGLLTFLGYNSYNSTRSNKTRTSSSRRQCTVELWPSLLANTPMFLSVYRQGISSRLRLFKRILRIIWENRILGPVQPSGQIPK